MTRKPYRMVHGITVGRRRKGDWTAFCRDFTGVARLAAQHGGVGAIRLGRAWRRCDDGIRAAGMPLADLIALWREHAGTRPCTFWFDGGRCGDFRLRISGEADSADDTEYTEDTEIAGTNTNTLTAPTEEITIEDSSGLRLLSDFNAAFAGQHIEVPGVWANQIQAPDTGEPLGELVILHPEAQAFGMPVRAVRGFKTGYDYWRWNDPSQSYPDAFRILAAESSILQGGPWEPRVETPFPVGGAAAPITALPPGHAFRILDDDQLVGCLVVDPPQPAQPPTSGTHARSTSINHTWYALPVALADGRIQSSGVLHFQRITAPPPGNYLSFSHAALTSLP